MTREEHCSQIHEAIGAFDFGGECIAFENYGSGHINDTFLVNVQKDGTIKRFILQRMNREIFKNPAELMENIVGVTSYLRKIIIENGGDPERDT